MAFRELDATLPSICTLYCTHVLVEDERRRRKKTIVVVRNKLRKRERKNEAANGEFNKLTQAKSMHFSIVSFARDLSEVILYSFQFTCYHTLCNSN
jgi:hypothetical protein